MAADTPARDALEDLAEAVASTQHPWDYSQHLGTLQHAIEQHPALIVAALVESGWRPSIDDLRAMGGRDLNSEIVYIGWAHHRYQATWTDPHIVMDFVPRSGESDQ